MLKGYEELWIDFPNYKMRHNADLLPLFINKPMMYPKEGNQICKKKSNRCYGLTADENYLLVCEYGDGGSEVSILMRKSWHL